MVNHLKFGDRNIPLPKSKPLRITFGILLVVFGCLGFLPILGFWMIPLGLLILSVDFASVRQFRRRATVKILRWWKSVRN